MQANFDASVVVIYGVPGSGKSTLSQRLSQYFGGKVLEADSYQSTPFSQEVWQNSRNLVFQKFEEWCETSMLIIDDDFLLKGQRKQYYHSALQRGITYIEILCTVQWEDLLIRNVNRPPAKRLPLSVLEQCWNKLERDPINQAGSLIYQGQDNIIENVVLAVERMRLVMGNLLQQEKYGLLQTAQNSSNLVHQCDLQLRKAVNNIMKTKTKPTPTITQLNALKTSYLTTLRGQSTTMSTQLTKSAFVDPTVQQVVDCFLKDVQELLDVL